MKDVRGKSDKEKVVNKVFALGILGTGLSILGVFTSTQPFIALIFFSICCALWMIIAYCMMNLYIKESKKHTS